MVDAYREGEICLSNSKYTKDTSLIFFSHLSEAVDAYKCRV